MKDCRVTLRQAQGPQDNDISFMDDKEYYSLMNRSSSWALQQAIKKARKEKSSEPSASKTSTTTYASLELRQGKADAEMLLEKKD